MTTQEDEYEYLPEFPEKYPEPIPDYTGATPSPLPDQKEVLKFIEEKIGEGNWTLVDAPDESFGQKIDLENKDIKFVDSTTGQETSSKEFHEKYNLTASFEKQFSELSIEGKSLAEGRTLDGKRSIATHFLDGSGNVHTFIFQEGLSNENSELETSEETNNDSNDSNADPLESPVQNKTVLDLNSLFSSRSEEPSVQAKAEAVNSEPTITTNPYDYSFPGFSFLKEPVQVPTTGTTQTPKTSSNTSKPNSLEKPLIDRGSGISGISISIEIPRPPEQEQNDQDALTAPHPATSKQVSKAFEETPIPNIPKIYFNEPAENYILPLGSENSFKETTEPADLTGTGITIEELKAVFSEEATNKALAVSIMGAGERNTISEKVFPNGYHEEIFIVPVTNTAEYVRITAESPNEDTFHTNSESSSKNRTTPQEAIRIAPAQLEMNSSDSSNDGQLTTAEPDQSILEKQATSLTVSNLPEIKQVTTIVEATPPSPITAVQEWSISLQTALEEGISNNPTALTTLEGKSGALELPDVSYQETVTTEEQAQEPEPELGTQSIIEPSNQPTAQEDRSIYREVFIPPTIIIEKPVSIPLKPGMPVKIVTRVINTAPQKNERASVTSKEVSPVAQIIKNNNQLTTKPTLIKTPAINFSIKEMSVIPAREAIPTPQEIRPERTERAGLQNHVKPLPEPNRNTKTEYIKEKEIIPERTPAPAIPAPSQGIRQQPQVIARPLRTSPATAPAQTTRAKQPVQNIQLLRTERSNTSPSERISGPGTLRQSSPTPEPIEEIVYNKTPATRIPAQQAA